MLLLALRIYRGIVSPILTLLSAPFGLGCRFTPTCSQYALEAVKQHGAIRGSMLSVRRLCRCHPWGGSGYDPVPEHRQCECRPSPVARACRSLRSSRGDEAQIVLNRDQIGASSPRLLPDSRMIGSEHKQGVSASD